MRRFGLILVALGCFLSFAAGSGRSFAEVRAATETISEGSGAAEEWRCERDCNSDLNLPRIPAAVTPAQTAVPAPHRGIPAARAAGDRLHPADLTRGRGAQETRISEFPIRFPGQRPADWYVFRLRRIVI